MSKQSINAQPAQVLKTSGSAVAATAALSQLPIERVAHAAGSDTISVALVGCGGRGSGAISQIRNTRECQAGGCERGSKNAKVRVAGYRKQFNDWVDVPEDRVFGGLDGYKSAIDAAEKMV